MDLNKNYFIVGFICLAIGASFSFFKKPIIEYKETVKYEIKEVEKVKVEKDTFTKIKETKLPDGTTIKETEIVDRDKIEKISDKNTKLESSKELSQKLIYKHRFELKQTMNKKLDFNTNLSYTYKVYDPLFLQLNINDKIDYQISIGIQVEL